MDNENVYAYQAEGTVTVAAGDLVALQPKQAARRGVRPDGAVAPTARIEPVPNEDDWYLARETIQVKRGETFALRDPISKGQWDRVSPLSPAAKDAMGLDSEPEPEPEPEPPKRGRGKAKDDGDAGAE